MALTKQTQQDEICQMFDRIAGTYDRVNRVLSLGRDRAWRRALAHQIPKNALKTLDIAAGTADLLVALEQALPHGQLWGVDLSEQMLALGQKKIRALKLEHKIKLEKADACALPFADNFFDATSIAFGIRNISDMKKALSEIVRVLKPSARVYILEFSLPDNFLLRTIYLAYFRYWLPFVGGALSGEREAYKYLNRTVEDFPKPEIFCEGLAQAGFKNIEVKALSYGIAMLYSAEAP